VHEEMERKNGRKREKKKKKIKLTRGSKFFIISEKRKMLILNFIEKLSILTELKERKGYKR